MLEEERIDIDKHFEIVGDFECNNYEPLDNYLKQESFNVDKDGCGNTYVILNNSHDKIICYYTLRANSLIINDVYAPVIELSKLAVDNKYSRLGIGTQCIMDNIIPKITEVQKHIGVIGLLVFADTEEALAFYKFLGFTYFGIYDKNANSFLITDDGFNDGCHLLILNVDNI
ncbi:GNAT family N-acetyltransferase [[Clostridium] innocuum]|uniref:GNAT family N-acetyltransferase n=1 Tax=Clostridium innocuum TaxID=1522 RepID=UPI000D6BEF7F|nr:GNAT family N-acetyltransferase [[Clostridium] innocuum]PWJ09716.1 acetyltransferase (GNAT) family protein [[Clostridium] innocuum]SSA49468.1 hypothetical protein SAMN04487929_1284 [[Clostridium] innocuum]